MDQTLAHDMLVLSRSFASYTATRMKELGLHYGTLFLVLYLGRHPDCTQAELTEALHLDWGHSQRTVTGLAEAGFLQRERIGRAYHLRLTPKGEEAFDILHRVFFDWDRQALAVLTPSEQQQLRALTAKVRAQLDKKENLK